MHSVVRTTSYHSFHISKLWLSPVLCLFLVPHAISTSVSVDPGCYNGHKSGWRDLILFSSLLCNSPLLTSLVMTVFGSSCCAFHSVSAISIKQRDLDEPTIASSNN